MKNDIRAILFELGEILADATNSGTVLMVNITTLSCGTSFGIMLCRAADKGRVGDTIFSATISSDDSLYPEGWVNRMETLIAGIREIQKNVSRETKGEENVRR